MHFADPHVCPDCRGTISGQPACPACGLDLTTDEVRQLWQTLLRADQLLAQASHHRSVLQPVAAQSVPQPAPVAPVHPQASSRMPPMPPMPAFPVPPLRSPVARKERSWPVGTILLVLGAFGLVVAGLIFVTRSWDNLGLAGRTLILLGVTAAIAGLGVWVTKRPLRASAEAVWAVFLALLTLDFFAARHENLAGLRGLSPAGGSLAWGLVLLGVSVGIAWWARRHVKVALVVPAVAGGVAITLGGVGSGAIPSDIDFAWRAIIALIVAGLMALATRPAGLAPMTLVARIVIAGFFIGAYGAALVVLVWYAELDQLVGDGHGGPMLLMVVASLVVAWLVSVVRIPLTALAVVGATALIVTPAVAGLHDDSAWAVVSVLAVTLAAAGMRGQSDWMRGVRLGAIPAIAGLGLLQLDLLESVAQTMGIIVGDAWEASWNTRLDAAAVDNVSAWLVPVALVALIAATWFVTQWPELARAKRYSRLVVAATAAVGLVNSVVALRLPVWTMAVVLLAAAAVAALGQLRGMLSMTGPITVGLVASAGLLAAASEGVSVWTWLAGAVVLGALAFVDEPVVMRQIHAVGASALAVAGAAAAGHVINVGHGAPALVALVVALVLVASAAVLLPKRAIREAVEVTAGSATFIALVTPGSTSELVVRWTIAGVALIAVSFAASDRRAYLWPGIAALVVAYILLIVDSGFSFVEAYTLPLGAMALGVGLYLVRRMPEASTWTLLGPGLALAMLPSVPQALAEPTELRALLFAVASLVVLACGAQLHWQAPFIAGVVGFALIVLFNIGPYANAAPRVVVIALGSAILLGVGITWEDRVRDGRKIIRYVRAMR